jgi:exopolysaccharide production protein ExoZ
MKNAKQLLSIQYLRAFAALAIVVHHAREQFPGFEAIFPSDIGSAAVDIFFIISGFIMVFITEMGNQGAGKFIVNRITRIAPLYWIYSILTACLYAVASGLFKSNGLTFEHFILSVLFIPHINPGDGSLSPLIKIGWTLNYEMFFYVVFAIAMLVDYSKRVLLSFGCLIILVLIGAFYGSALPTVGQFYVDDIMLEFAAGMLLCRLYRMGRINPLNFIKTAPIVLGVFALAIYLAPLLLTYRSIKFGIPAMVIVTGMLAFERFLPKLKALLFIGDASYSIYLAHLMGIALLRYLYPRLGIPTEGLLSALSFIAISLTIACLAGFASYLWIELPIVKLCRSLQKSWSDNTQKS